MKKKTAINLFIALCISSLIVFIILSVLDVFLQNDFKPLEYGAGLGSTLTAIGVAIGIKKSMENDK
jgi:pilus assembly protein TadC